MEEEWGRTIFIPRVLHWVLCATRLLPPSQIQHISVLVDASDSKCFEDE